MLRLQQDPLVSRFLQGGGQLDRKPPLVNWIDFNGLHMTSQQQSVNLLLSAVLTHTGQCGLKV